MGVCVEKLPCPDCGGSDCLQSFYDDQKDSYYSICFGGCGMEAKGDPYGDSTKREKPKAKSRKEIEAEIKSVQKCQLFKGTGKERKFRGIPGEYFPQWSIRLLLSEYDGVTPYAVGFPYSDEGTLSGWKIATLKKKNFYAVGETKNADVFGLERALKIGGKRLYITEGEWDAVSLDYCLVESNKHSKFGKKGYPVVSLTSGGGSITKNLKKIRARIKNRFEEIVLVLDNDEVGKAAEKEAQKLLPDVLRADKPPGCKDANDAVKKGMIKQMAEMVQWLAHKPPIEGVRRVSDVLTKALEKPKLGLSYPDEELTRLTLGQRFGEAVCLGGGTGCGKTVTAHKWAAHNMVVHKLPCFMVLLEEQNGDTVKNVASKIDKINYSNPNAEYDPQKLVDTANILESKLFMWESEGDQALRFDMDEIIEAIRFNVAEYGVKFVYFDNWTRVVDHLESGEANAFINKYSSIIENLATQLDIHIMTYSHLNTPKFGPSHEEGAPVYPSQFTGSRGIMRSFPMLMSFRRNKYAKFEDGQDKNHSIVGVLKSRKYGNEGEVKHKYDFHTGDLVEYEWEGELESPTKGRK